MWNVLTAPDTLLVVFRGLALTPSQPTLITTSFSGEWEGRIVGRAPFVGDCIGACDEALSSQCMHPGSDLLTWLPSKCLDIVPLCDCLSVHLLKINIYNVWCAIAHKVGNNVQIY